MEEGSKFLPWDNLQMFYLIKAFNSRQCVNFIDVMILFAWFRTSRKSLVKAKSGVTELTEGC